LRKKLASRSTDNKKLFPIDQLLDGLGAAVLKSIRAPFGIFGIDYRVIWANRAMAWIHQKEPEEIIGKICYQTCYGATKPCDHCPLEDVVNTGRTQVFERGADFPDGVRRWGEVHAYPVRGQDKKTAAVIVIVFDITDKKQNFQKQKAYSKFLSEKLSETAGKDQQILLGDQDVSITVKLSRRETEILRLIAEGYTNLQISEHLSISQNTVKSHVNHIFNKLGVNDRTQAAVLATRHHLL
jgi:DNA-binding CsgD family transcriptional regulator